MPIPAAVLELVARFDLNRAAYHAGQYNEAQVRQEFINPFFAALGWDVYNTHGYSEKYKEVVHEDALRMSGQSNAPDYAFRLGGQRVFFVEAKKPAVHIKTDISPAYQLRRYAWSAKLPVSLLTDFEEFAVYDCRIKPDKTDQAAVARIVYLTYRDYADRWDEIAALFSPEAIRQGALDRYVESKQAKKGTAEVDAAFLAEIEGWREVLARNIALRNTRLTVRELNRAVQMTIDRLIFLRICEDRGIEPYGRLRDTVTGAPAGQAYAQLGALLQQADDRYNSGLFHFKPEKGRAEPADDFTLQLDIDDKVLKPIVTGMYYPDSPYEFSVLPADILGQVYEQFLGKVIRLTAGGHARVEEKPEVKKAGGVYYTPTYIVDYIVTHTVGKLLENKTPRQVWGSARTAPLRVLDPACGSGTFLLQAYQYLLDWYLEQYTADDPDLHARRERVVQTAHGEWVLAPDERKRILLAHIYGVDIDPQAVEVTRLSLLLKVLEGEGAQGRQISFVEERVLPDLDDNIRCGNSLIGPDYYAARQGKMFDEEEMYRVNAFDWKEGFPQAWGAGGFDVVIGNPPYIRIHHLVDYYPSEVQHIQRQYSSAHFGKVDIYVAFVEKGFQLLKQSGFLGFIVPNKFIQADYGVGLRKLIADNRALECLVDFRYAQVFESATTYTCLLFLSKEERNDFIGAYNIENYAPREFLQTPAYEKQSTNSLSERAWSLAYSSESRVLERVEGANCLLPDVAELVITGVKTGTNDVFVFELLENREKTCVVQSVDGSSHEFEADLLKPYWKAESIKRYYSRPGSRVLLYPYGLIGSQTCLLPETKMQADYPKIWAYLKSHRQVLESRQKGKLKGPGWYGLSFASSLKMFASPKIVTATLAPRNSFFLDSDGYLFPQGAGGGCGIVPKKDSSVFYLLGLLNSKLLTFYFQRISTVFRSGWYAYEPRYLYRIPIHITNLNDPTDIARHDRMVALVETMLDLHKRLTAAQIPQAKRLLQQQIEITDRQIDALVYELYGLTEEEIGIVEGA